MRHDRFANLIVASSGNILSATLSIFYVSLVGRGLGPALYADFNAALAASYIFTAVLAPISVIAVQTSAAANARGERTAALVAWQAVFAKFGPFVFVLVVAGAIAAWPISHVLEMRDEITLYVALPVALSATFAAVLRASLRGAGSYGIHAATSIGEAALRLAAGAAIVLLVMTPAAALSAYVIAATVAGAAIAFRTARGRGVPPDLGPVWHTFAGALVLSVAISAASHIDVLIAKSRLDSTEAGLYGAAASIARLTALLLVPIEILFLPSLAHARVNVRRTLARLAGFALLCIAPALGLFAMWPERAITLVFGSRFSPAAPLLIILAANSALVFMTLLLGQFLLHSGSLKLLCAVVLAIPIVQSIALGWFARDMQAFATISLSVQTVGFLAAAAAAAAVMRRSPA